MNDTVSDDGMEAADEETGRKPSSWSRYKRMKTGADCVEERKRGSLAHFPKQSLWHN